MGTRNMQQRPLAEGPRSTALTRGRESGLRIGTSACLLGERVRHDGGDKRNAFITDLLARHVELVALCPEVAIGMGVPREPIQLLERANGVHAIGVQTPALDVTAALRGYGACMSLKLGDISGYIFKSRSPSCGIGDVPVYRQGRRRPMQKGTGLYAREWINRRPLLPVEDEARLLDPGARDNFLERIFFYYRWQVLCASGLSMRSVHDFHATLKLTLMAHASTESTLSALLDQAGPRLSAKLARHYLGECMRILKRRATRSRHARVLRYLARRLHDELKASERGRLQREIERYTAARAPLIVPVTLVNEHVRSHPVGGLDNQTYLNPSAAECALRYQQ
jgi:uncharacterized protein YbbK (DUF523 family)/uncharacterized protein YbgA (DUF1722 family)